LSVEQHKSKIQTMSTDIIAPEPMIIDAPPAEEAKVPEEHIERAEEAEEEAEEHTVALRLKEVWRTDRLFTVINDQTTDNSTIRGVINALREHKSVDGCITVERGYTESGSPGGRLYAEAGSLQNMPGYLRRFLAHGVYADIDIKNAFPTFLLQLCERARLKTPCLRRYVSDRDGVFAELRAHLDAKPDAAELFAHVDKNGLKRGMISILHGGDYRNAIFCHPDDTALPKGKWRRTLNPTTLPFCDAFTAEVKGIAAALARLPDHTGDWALAHKKAAKKQGHDGTGCRAHGNLHSDLTAGGCARARARRAGGAPGNGRHAQPAGSVRHAVSEDTRATPRRSSCSSSATSPSSVPGASSRWSRNPRAPP
jgi:hypothetical protein